MTTFLSVCLTGKFIDISTSTKGNTNIVTNPVLNRTHTRLNEFLRGQEINEHTVVEIVKKIQKENPSSGSFVHWSNTGDLVKYAESQPMEVAELLNQLFYSAIPVEERFEGFRQRGKDFLSSIYLERKRENAE